MRYVKFILLFLFIASQVESVAQTFPVSANLQLVPPYSVYLSDYTVGGNEQMKLNLFLRDQNEPSYPVKLAFVLEGAGIRIETNPNFAAPPIVLEGGVPQVLGADELGIYLDPRNLLFNGITRQQYEQRAALPEGFYRFSFRVLDYRRKDVQLSREATANAWFVLNDPPRLNTPVCGTTLPLRDPQNIFFQWLPMGAASPNSALTTEYEFTLVEIRPPGRNPNDAINVGVPLFQFTTQQTSLVYGILEPALIPGQEYAFRVRAKDTNGKDLFKNQGYSEVCTFKFGEVQAVPPPEGLNIYPESERRAKVTWYQMLEADRFRVEYRKKPAAPEEANRAWFTKETLEDNTVLNDLEAETEYELRVANVVKNIISRYTEIKTFRTLPVRVFACGQQVDNITPANQKPLLSPFIGQLWKIGKFDMEVMQVRGSNGTYSGLAAVIIPYLGFRVYGTFKDIKVNENREVIVGEVVGLSEGVDAFKKRFEKEVPQVQEGDPTATAGAVTGPILFDGVDEKTDKDVDSVYVDSKGTIVVVDSEGGQKKIEPTKGKGTRITDKDGDQWIVDKDGKVSKVPSTAISNAPPAVALTSPSQANYAIEFLANSKQRNGFDQKEDTYNLPDYETIKVNGKDYSVAWKSVESGQQDWVNAKAIGQTTFPKAVGFKTTAGEAASQASSDASQKQVMIMGRADGQEEELMAYVKVKEPSAKDEQVLELGKLNIKSYSKVRKKVIVVPVNDAEAPNGPALAAELNNIYRQAVAEWDVTVAEPFTIAAENLQGLDDGQSGMLSSFPPKMREFRRAFKNDRTIDGSSYYVFLVKGSGSQRAGFMPFKREFGFVFTDRTSNVTTTIAHELGHGAFRLRHTFSSEDFKATERNTTNLMDYNGGTVLKKYQWDFVHDPESMNGWLQDDEASASYSFTKSDIWIRNLNEIACAQSRGLREAEINIDFDASERNALRYPIKFNFQKIDIEVLVDQLPSVNKYTLNLSSKNVKPETSFTMVTFSIVGSVNKLVFKIPNSSFSKFNTLVSSPSPGFFQQLVSEIPTNEGDDAYSAISRLPVCAIDLIEPKKRIQYIDWMVSREMVTSEDQEKLIASLFENVQAGKIPDFVKQLEQYSNWRALFESFDNTATQQALFKSLMKLYQQTTIDKGEVKAVFDFNMLNTASPLFTFTSNVTVNYSKGKLSFVREITKGIWTSDYFISRTEERVLHAETELFAPVCLIIDDDHTNLGLQPGTKLRSVPAILAAFFIEKKDSEQNKQLAYTGLDIALLAAGVGEVTAAIKAFQAARTVRSLFRLTLAASDFAASYTDFACQSSDSELCNQWKEVSFYIQIGLLSLSAADALDGLIKKTDALKLQGAGNDLPSFINKTLTQKLDDIKGIWNTKYPIQEMLEGRSFFEDVMGQYRYLKSSGWEHTGDISEFFKGVDFYKGSKVGDQIFANTAVSMKTTITTNVDTWLASAPMQKNIGFLRQGLYDVNGLPSNNMFMKMTNAEIHIYMPKANITESLKTTWMNKLNTVDPKIKFEIKALEDFIQ